LNNITILQCVIILCHSINSSTLKKVWYSHCRFFISQAIVISSVASHHSRCQHHFSSPVFHIFKSYRRILLTNTVYSNQCHGVFTFSDSILHAQCHGYRWYPGGEGCDENIYYTITCSCVYPATAFGKFRRDCLLKSDMSSSRSTRSLFDWNWRPVQARSTANDTHVRGPAAARCAARVTKTLRRDSPAQIRLVHALPHASFVEPVLSGRGPPLLSLLRSSTFTAHAGWQVLYTARWWERSALQDTFCQNLSVWGMSRMLYRSRMRMYPACSAAARLHAPRSSRYCSNTHNVTLLHHRRCSPTYLYWWNHGLSIIKSSGWCAPN